MRVNSISSVNNKGISAYKNAMKEIERENSRGLFIDSIRIGNNSSPKKTFLEYGKNMKFSGEEEKTSFTNGEEDVRRFVNDTITRLNEMLGEDEYDKFAELGIVAEKEELGTIVTVYDRIQIELAAYGDGDISGLGISQEKIDKVLQSKGMSNAVKMAESIGKIGDEQKEFILKNEMEPTVLNLYKASHTYDGKSSKQESMTEEEWQQLKPQVEKLYEKNGIETTDKNIDAARWLIEREIPVTADNVFKLEDMDKVENQEDRNIEELKVNMALAEIFGKTCADGYMTKTIYDGETAREAVEVIEKADYEAVDYIAKNNITLNVENLKRYKELSKKKANMEENENIEEKETDGKNRQDTYRRILTEAKEVMTVAATITMQKMGVNVTYEELGNMVEQVKESENRYYSVFFKEPSSQKTDVLKQVMNTMAVVPQMPAAVIGKLEKDEDFTVNNIVSEGSVLKDTYDRAMVTYEAVGTEVRADLGDNIKKAFRNVDELLSQVMVQINDESRKAARILGYNNMEITRENVYHIMERVTEVEQVIKNITPKTAAYLIENGINPLDENIESLNDRLVLINQELGADVDEEYSRYLWKLEKSGKFDGKKREAYIELFRTLKMIQKMDTRSIGAVAGTGAQITLASLLSAERSRKKYNMDVEVDENTGFYEGRYTKNKLKDILDNITNNNELTEKNQLEHISVDKLEEMFINTGEKEVIRELEVQYSREQMIRNRVEGMTEEMFLYMLDGGAEITMENIYASSLITNSRAFRELFNKNGEREKRILDSFESEEEAQRVFDEINNEVAADLKEKQGFQNETSERHDISNVARFMAQSAKNKCYNIPVQIGENQIFVKVKFAHNDEEIPTISIDFDDEAFGRVSAYFEIENNEISGNIMCDKNEMRQILYENIEELNILLDKQINVHLVSGRRNESMGASAGKNHKYTNSELYHIAKTFLKSIKKWTDCAEVKV